MHTAQAIDIGPRERFQHGRVIVEGKAGEALDERGDRVVRARDTREWVMDALKASGALGHEREAQRRYDAALWLRMCHHKAGLTPKASMRYDTSPRDGGEMSDMEAWNSKAFTEGMRAMGGIDALVVERVSVENIPPTKISLPWLLRGLDALAKHRGIA